MLDNQSRHQSLACCWCHRPARRFRPSLHSCRIGARPAGIQRSSLCLLQRLPHPCPHSLFRWNWVMAADEKARARTIRMACSGPGCRSGSAAPDDSFAQRAAHAALGHRPCRDHSPLLVAEGTGAAEGRRERPERQLFPCSRKRSIICYYMHLSLADHGLLCY